MKKTNTELQKELLQLKEKVKELEVSKQKLQETEAILKANEERYKGIVQNTTSCIAVYKAIDEGKDFEFIEFNPMAEKAEKIKRDKVIGRKVTEVFPGVVEFGLFDVFRKVYKSGKAEHFPISVYQDDRIQGYRENYIYKLSSGEIVAVYQDLTEKKKFEKRLVESEAKFKGMFDSKMIGIIFWNADGEILDANKAFLDMLGYSKSEVLSGSVSWKQMTPPEYEEIDNKALKEAAETGYVTPFEKEYIHKNGKRIPIILGAATVDDLTNQGIAFVLNNSSKKETETALKESELKFRTLVTNFEEIIYMIDKNGIFQLSEGKGLAKLGLKGGDVVGQSVFELYKDYPEMLEEMRMTFEGEFRHNEYEVAGQCFRNWYSPHFNEAGVVIGLLGLTINVTELKKTEQALLDQKETLDNVLEGTNAGTWDWNVQTGEVEFNERWAEIMGKTLSELTPLDINTWINSVHPDDLENANELLEKVFNKELNYYDVVFRQPHKNGSFVWVNARGKIVEWTEDGKPLRMSGTHIDITELKLTELELQKIKEELEQIVDERTAEIQKKNKELDDALKVFVGRENKIRTLQDEIERLKGL